MRAALICLPPAAGGDVPTIAGKSVCARQLDFAKLCGCELILAYGHGVSAEALSLRHRAERSGLRFQVVSNIHSLIGIVGANDTLLVMQEGLLPEAEPALAALSSGEQVLFVSSGPGMQAGFERIDIDRAWAGAMTVPGSLLDLLQTLPEDSAPAPALLRIALQHRLPGVRLPDELLDNSGWCIIASADQASLHERHWVRRALGEGRHGAISSLVARWCMRRVGGRLAAERHTRPILLGLLVILLGCAVAAAIFERAVLGFALLALAAPLTEAILSLSRLAVAPFGSIGRWPLLRRCLDLALVVCAALAIDGFWYRELLAPMVLGASLLLLDRKAGRPLVELLRDRGIVAGAAAFGIATILAEPALALLSVIVLAANFTPEPKDCS